jgi:hypothetical protein
MTAGEVWACDTASWQWREVTPVKPSDGAAGFGYGCVSVDPSDPGTVMASTFCRWNPGDELYRSIDGGRTWRALLADSVSDRKGAVWTAAMRPHWISSVAIDPFDRERALFTTGYGIWAGTGLARPNGAQPVHWTFANKGLEETVPLDLASPQTGAPLLSAVADLDGFRHDTFTRPAEQFPPEPRFSSAEAIDFAANRPEIVVRTGVPRDSGRRSIGGAISHDGGLHWTAFPSVPSPESEPIAFGGDRTLALSADGRTIVWAPQGRQAQYSRDECESWRPCVGLTCAVLIVADRAAPARFYAFDPAGGTAYRSEDGGATFAAAAELPRSRGDRKDLPVELRAVPGRAGDVWLVAYGRLFRSIDGAARFSPVPTLDKAFAIGFGHAAPRRDYPALFAAGEWTGESGVARSDDAGASWKLLTDNRHRFASIYRVIGDTRTFGRVFLATGGRGIIVGDPVSSLP